MVDKTFDGIKEFLRLNKQIFRPIPQLLFATSKTRNQFALAKDKLVLDMLIEAQERSITAEDTKFFTKFADRFMALKDRFKKIAIRDKRMRDMDKVSKVI